MEQELGLPASLRHLSDEDREEIRKYVRNRVNAVIGEPSILLEISDWHRDQSIGWHRASIHTAIEKPEPTRSCLTKKSQWHAEAAFKLKNIAKATR